MCTYIYIYIYIFGSGRRLKVRCRRARERVARSVLAILARETSNRVSRIPEPLLNFTSTSKKPNIIVSSQK